MANEVKYQHYSKGFDSLLEPFYNIFVSSAFLSYLFILCIFFLFSFSGDTQAEDTVDVCPSLNDPIGFSKSISKQGEFSTSQTKFLGGVVGVIAGGQCITPIAAKLEEEVAFETTIEVDPQDVGKQANILFLLAQELPPKPYDGGSDTTYFVIDESSEISSIDLYANVDVWMAQLKPYMSGVTLERDMYIDLGAWQFSKVSQYYVFVGYQLNDGTIVYNFVPIIVEAEKTPSLTPVTTMITDPTTRIGVISTINGGQELVAVHGEKDSQGNLTSVTDITYAVKDESSQTISSANFEIKDGVTNPLTVTFSDSSGNNKTVKVKYENYDPEKKTADVTVVEQDEAGNETEIAKSEQQPVDELPLSKDIPLLGGYLKSDFSNLADVINKWAFGTINGIMKMICDNAPPIIKFVDWFIVQKMSDGGSMCKPFEGKDIPLSPLSCYTNPLDNASRISNGLELMMCLNKPLGCLEALVDGLASAGDGLVSAWESLTGGECNVCVSMKKMCDRYTGIFWDWTFLNSCSCDPIVLPDQEGKNFKSECLALGNTKWGSLGDIHRCASPDDGKSVW